MPALGAPSQEEFLKGMSEGVSGNYDPTKLLAVIFCAAGFIVVVALISQRRKHTIAPKVLNHPGKLLKEVAKGVNLKGAEVKQLKALAEGQNLSSPLLLLICPSVLARAARSGGVKIDHQVINGLARKLSASSNTTGSRK